MMPRRLVAVLLTAIALADCTSAATTGPHTTVSAAPVPSATATPSRPTATATASPSPSPTRTPGPTATVALPVEPILVATNSGPTEIVYEISVAPLPTPTDRASIEARAEKIGGLVGLGKPRALYNPFDDPDEWRASWDSSIDGIPVDPAYDALLLEMRADGTARSFVQTIGPLEPKPARTLTKAQALEAAGLSRAPEVMELVWTFKPGGSDTMRLAWYLSSPNVQPDGESWPCVLYLDAGTGEELMAGCVS
jgi:hypothetical protein